MDKIIYFPNYKLIHETKKYYYFASYGMIPKQHNANKKFLIRKYNMSAFLYELTPTFPGKKVNEWINSLTEENKEKYKIIRVDKEGKNTNDTY